MSEAIHAVREDLPFENVAFVPLPDPLHAVWELPAGETDDSTRWKRIKATFTKKRMKDGGSEQWKSASRESKGERGVWQKRFFEQTCRDETDLKHCVDDTHVNPLKHQLVSRVRDWEWSTFHRYVAAGEYDINWGNANAVS